MERSIPQRVGADPNADLVDTAADSDRAWPAALDEDEDDAAEGRSKTTLVVLSGLALVLLCLVVFLASRPVRNNFYIHFVWQADAWLHGQTAIAYPVDGVDHVTPGNSWYQDVMPIIQDGVRTGRAIIPFPPLPALVLLPFVAAYGLFVDEQLLAMLLAALDVGIAYWMLGALPIRHSIRVLTALFLGLGTVLWYAAATGTTWFWAHIVAVACLLLAVGIALRIDPDASVAVPVGGTRVPIGLRPVGRFVRDALHLSPAQIVVGFLFGLAITARLTIGFGFPFFLLVGGGRNWLGRGVAAGLGAVIPVAVLLLYTQAATGHLFNPAYDYQYQLEARGYWWLHYNPAWSIEDIRYVPQNLQIMLFNLPQFLPNAGTWGNPLCTAGEARALLDPNCPLALPDPVGTSVILTSPAYLLAPFALRPLGRLRIDRATAGAGIAVVVIAFVNLMHFSQGWVQFGYRFSNDFVPFALILVALGAARTRKLWPLVLLVILSIVANLWGVYWGGALGW